MKSVLAIITAAMLISACAIKPPELSSKNDWKEPALHNSNGGTE